jgi:transposase
MIESVDDHQCAWREEAALLRGSVAELKSEVAALKRMVFGKKSERMPSVAEALRKDRGKKANAAKTKERRRQNAEARQNLPTEEVHIPVPRSERSCPSCGPGDLKPLGEGEVSFVYEYVPATFVRRKIVREKLACSCGDFVVTAEAPPKAIDKGQYGPGFIAHVVTSKCADSLPLYRMAKQYKRAGVPMARSTLCDLFHGAADSLRPLYEHLMSLIAQSSLVQADETTMRVQQKGKTRKGYLWTFLAGDLIGYRFSPSRSGKTPLEVLGSTAGTLVVDAYTGYNQVTTPEGRTRAGCLAHARRKFFDALETAPEAQAALDLILDVYQVEHAATDGCFARTDQHLARRQTESRAAMERLRSWCEEHKPHHLPKGPLGRAIRYALAQWDPLTRFLEDPQIPVDNNASERALRVAALGRKNYLFVGHDDAGQNAAVLYSLVSTCEAIGVNPLDYLADVLIRVQTHPNSAIDELLPHKWHRPDDPADSKRAPP